MYYCIPYHLALGYDVVYTIPQYQRKYRTKTPEKYMCWQLINTIYEIFKEKMEEKGKQSKLHNVHIHHLYLAQNITRTIVSR